MQPILNNCRQGNTLINNIMKTTKIVRFFAFVFFVFLSTTTFSQTAMNASELSTKWSLLTEQDGVKLFVKRESCKLHKTQKPLDYLLVKVVNESGEAVTSNFQIGLHYNEGCTGCEQNVETYRSVLLASNSSEECDCTFKSNGQLSLLIKNPNHLDDRVFESIELIDFKLD